MSDTPVMPAECYCGSGKSPAECDQCCADAENATEIRRLILRADDMLAVAMKATGQARSAIEELTSSRVYDIELAENAEGQDAVAELERAGLSLRHAHRIIAWRKRVLAEEEGR